MKKLIAANWKMNKTMEGASSFIGEFRKLAKGSDAEIAICPPFTILAEMKKLVAGSGIMLGAQNMHFEASGAYTGEISPLMLKEIGCEYVILGHSERREFFGEKDEQIHKKIISALNNGLKPILCVGETLEQRQTQKTEDVLENQLINCLKDIKDAKNITIAYEPVWAISRGNANVKSATKADAEESHLFIRKVLEGIFGEEAARNTRILYGGSMKPGNAKELLSMPNIDGGLVGNASLDAKSFAEIIMSAK
ncbi:triose-phosphate isomerase [Candidatus Woesearchaeota archaeon]|nr:triose-phosphate isomerase [Candidatus Woesearchaeota archaeon]